MTPFSFTLIYLIVAAGLCSFMPAFTRPDLFFAVTVPPHFRRTEVGRKITRKYLLFGWGGTVLLALLSSVAGNQEDAAKIGVLGTTVVWFAAFLLARHAAIPHAVSPDPVRTAVLSTRRETLPGGIIAMVFPFVFLALKGVEFHARWEEIPDPFPIHWGLNGPDRWTERTPFSVYGSLFGVALICGIVLVTAWGIVHASRQIAVTGENAGSEQRFRRTGVLGLMALAYAFALTLPPIPNMHLTVPYAPVLLIGASLAVVITLAMSGQGGTRLPEYRPILGSSHPTGDGTSDNYWKLGMFYFNRSDPALVVEKRFGVGWTLNFGHPICWLLMAALLGWPLLRRLLG